MIDRYAKVIVKAYKRTVEIENSKGINMTLEEVENNTSKLLTDGVGNEAGDEEESVGYGYDENNHDDLDQKVSQVKTPFLFTVPFDLTM